jgi:hypothetical protein
MVGNRQDAYFFGFDRIDHGKGKVLHDQSPPSLSPERSQKRVLHQQSDRVFEFREECLRKGGASSFPVVLGCIPKVPFSLGVQRKLH